MRLFICHASKDKDDFVRPLAEALKKHYDVWFDEYCLRLGDSLLANWMASLLARDRREKLSCQSGRMFL
jgi:hypothetical protein